MTQYGSPICYHPFMLEDQDPALVWHHDHLRRICIPRDRVFCIGGIAPDPFLYHLQPLNVRMMLSTGRIPARSQFYPLPWYRSRICCETT